MKIHHIISALESYAPLTYQEHYDNSRLLTGNKHWDCTGALLTLDAVEEVVDEAIELGCNLIIAHHPIVFSGLKSITGKNYVERTVIKAIKNDIAIYACHTNLDNQIQGVNAQICDRIGVVNRSVLRPMSATLLHLTTFVPQASKSSVLSALFEAGAGHIGNYSHCSFSLEGEGTFLPEKDANPIIGEVGILQYERESRVEVLVPVHAQSSVLQALHTAHPYEEVAYYLQKLENKTHQVGAGLIGELIEPMDEKSCLELLKKQFRVPVIRHTSFVNKPIQRVAVCGGAGSFLLQDAIAQQADLFITADMKYHDFFDADKQIVVADIGHYESEQYTSELFANIIKEKYSNFAVQYSKIDTNPVNYY